MYVNQLSYNFNTNTKKLLFQSDRRIELLREISFYILKECAGVSRLTDKMLSVIIQTLYDRVRNITPVIIVKTSHRKTEKFCTFQ